MTASPRPRRGLQRLGPELPLDALGEAGRTRRVQHVGAGHSPVERLGLAASTASSYGSYPSIVPSSISRNVTAGVWVMTSAAWSALADDVMKIVAPQSLMMYAARGW